MLTIDFLGRQVYGPYIAVSKRKGKERPRRTVVCKYGVGRKAKRKKMSYARWKMECHLKRELLRSEEVDHDDDDTMNDKIGNLKIMSHGDNVRKSHPGARMLNLRCRACGIKFRRAARRTIDPKHSYCSQACGAKARLCG